MLRSQLILTCSKGFFRSSLSFSLANITNWKWPCIYTYSLLTQPCHLSLLYLFHSRLLHLIIGSSRSYYGDARKTTSIKKWIYILPTNLGILLSNLLSLSLSKLSRSWIWDTAIDLKSNFKKVPVVVHVLQATQNWSFHAVVLQRHMHSHSYAH